MYASIDGSLVRIEPPILTEFGTNANSLTLANR